MVQPAQEETQALPQEPMRVIVHGEDDWEEAIRQERLSFLAHHATEVIPSEGGPANVVAKHQRRENREYHDGGNIFLQQRNILQQVIQQFQQPPQLEMILETQRDVMHQLVQEAHRVRQEVKDMKNAMVHALQTVDKNHASHDQIIQAQAQ